MISLVLRALRGVVLWPLFGLGLIVVSSCFVLGNVASAIAFPITPVGKRTQLGRYIIHRAFRHAFIGLTLLGLARFDLRELEALREEKGGLILAPNHPSMIDVMLIVSRLPDVACIMKADLWDHPLLGVSSRLAGYIRNDSVGNMIRSAAADLKAGGKLLLFPEGTRTVTPPVNEFKGGIGLIAKRSGFPIQTIFIETDNPYLGKNWPLFRRPPLPIVYRVRLGKRFLAAEHPDTLLADMQGYFEESLALPARAEVVTRVAPDVDVTPHALS